MKQTFKLLLIMLALQLWPTAGFCLKDGDTFTAPVPLNGNSTTLLTFRVISEKEKTVRVSTWSDGCDEFASFMDYGGITIPSKVNGYNVIEIGDGAFSAEFGCFGLTSVEIPNSVTSIGNHAFYGCGELTSIVIPNSVTSIGYDAFAGCSGLTSIIVKDGNPKYDSRNNCNAIIQTNNNELLLGCQSTIIPNSVTSIGYDAFAYCSGLTSVVIPNSVTSIGASAFAYCSGLTSVEIPNSVTSIGYSAFEGCSSLISVVIPNSVTSIGMRAFMGCSRLTSIEIPNSVTCIDFWAFHDCSRLTSIEIPNSVTSIDYSAFEGCSSIMSIIVKDDNPKYDSRNNCNAIIQTDNNELLTGCQSTIIPNSVTSIGASAFAYCSGLTSVVIPNSVTSIGMRAFMGCSRLTSIEIPNSVTCIDFWAFHDCSRLISISSHIQIPFSFSSDCFDSSVYEKATLYVPENSLGLYLDTEGWMNFKNIELFGEITYTLSITVTNDNGEDLTNQVSVIWYDNDGRELGTGASIGGIEEGTTIYYSILLDEALGRIYREVVMDSLKVNGQTTTCVLQKIAEVSLNGRVSAVDIDETPATVNVTQRLNGKYEKTYSTKTDAKGDFSLTVYDDVTDITITLEDCFDATIHRDRLMDTNGNVGTIPLSLISGFPLSIDISMLSATKPNEEASSNTIGIGDVEFSLTNQSTGKQIEDFVVQNGNVIIKSGVSIGDKIELKTKSRKRIFADAITTLTLQDGANDVKMELIELGGINVSFTNSSSGSVVGYLYDDRGILVSRTSFIGNQANLVHLTNGSYTLITMEKSQMFESITDLSEWNRIGLQEGRDYVTTTISVEKGVVSMVEIGEIPVLNETPYYYTNNNTYFNVNKTNVTVGKYLTLSAHLELKEEYASKLNDVLLTVDLPDGCQMVNNSAVIGRQLAKYTQDGNRIMIPLTKENYREKVRFCVIPVDDRDYKVSAYASLNIGDQVLQPIGIAPFTAKGLALNAPSKVADTKITVRGEGTGGCEVKVFDNDVLIGKTTSLADGSWSLECELDKPYSHSFHDIQAKIQIADGLELPSETKEVEYDKNNLVPEKVTMLYYNPEFSEHYNIVFDLISGITTPSSYYYFPYKNWPNWYQTFETEPKDFTFLADFTRNDTTLIKNVNIKVLNTDGTVRTLPAIYDGRQNHWVATTKYSSSNKLPQNVTIEYDCIDNPFDSERMMEENMQLANIVKNYVENIDATKCDVLESNDSVLICQYQTKKMDNPIFIRYMRLCKKEWIDELTNKNYVTTENNGVVTCMSDTIINDRYITWVWDEDNLFQIDISKYRDYENTLQNEVMINRAPPTLGEFIGNSVLNIFCNLGDILTIRREYLNAMNDYDAWLKKHYQFIVDMTPRQNYLNRLINQKCPDGSLQLDESLFYYYTKSIKNWQLDYFNMSQEFGRNLERLERDIRRRLDASCWISATAGLVGIIPGLRAGASGILKTIGSAIGVNMVTSTAQEGYNYLLRNEFYTSEQLSNWYYQNTMNLMKDYNDLTQSIVRSYKKCKKKKKEKEEEEEEFDDENNDNKPDFPAQPSTPIHDPSGYVYEAVTSNRLQGVTATVYQKAQKEDMYGDITEEAVAWNAEDYSQKNPLITDQDGFYRWDVPQGMWQVKYEKEGYETMYSDWLPVPPPQLDVNIGMYQGIAPQVEKMRGFESGIVIDMSKYMKPETYGKNSITVTRNGQKVNGTIIMLNAEVNEYEGREYASKMKFIPEMGFNVTDNVVVTVHKEVESYCGIKMENDHTETVKIEPEIKEIVSDSVITVTYQGAKVMDVFVLPKDASVGKILHVDSSSPIIASLSENEVEIDSDGRATFTLNGELPGGANLSYTVDGSDVSASTKVYVTLENDMVAMPQASIRSGETVNSGTLLVLTCETEDATIYYTLDGSCPCDETKRIKYEGPITINGDVTVKAIAVKEDMDDSDIATFMYILNGIQGLGYDKTNVNIEYQNGAFVITGAEGATCNIYDLAGQLVASKQRIARCERMVFSKKGVYVVNVETTDGVTVAKKMVVK